MFTKSAMPMPTLPNHSTIFAAVLIIRWSCGGSTGSSHGQWTHTNHGLPSQCPPHVQTICKIKIIMNESMRADALKLRKSWKAHISSLRMANDVNVCIQVSPIPAATKFVTINVCTSNSHGLLRSFGQTSPVLCSKGSLGASTEKIEDDDGAASSSGHLFTM